MTEDTSDRQVQGQRPHDYGWWEEDSPEDLMQKTF